MEANFERLKYSALSQRVVKGILQVPQDRLWLLREMAEAMPDGN